MSLGKKISSSLGLVILLAFLGWWLTGLSLFVRSASEAPPAAPLEKRDAIVALTGGSNRLDAGFNLLEDGAGEKLFISGVYRGVDVRQLLARWRDHDQAKLDCCVVLGFEADNTAGNAVETVKWLREEKYKSIYLVTSNYHMKRARLEFQRIAPELEIIPYPVIPSNFDIDNWWKDEDMRALVLREYMKYLATYIWHQFLAH